jgi:hypothetical protein
VSLRRHFSFARAAAPWLAVSLALGAGGCKDKEASKAGPGDSPSGAGAAAAKLSSKALEHLPAGCELTVYADVAKTLALPAAQKELIPAIDAADTKSASEGYQEMQKLLKDANIDPKKDLHSVALCANNVDQDDKQKVVVILGGQFRGDSVASAAPKKDPTDVISDLDGRKLLTGKTKKGATIVLTQAADGAILVGNDRALLESALKTGTAYKSEYALAGDSELGFNVSEGLITRALKGGGRPNPMTNSLKGVSRVFGSLRLGNPGVELHLTTASPAEATKMSAGLTELLAMLKKSAATEKSQVGELEALASTKTRVDGKDVVLEATWSKEGVEKAASELAKLIRDKGAKATVQK